MGINVIMNIIIHENFERCFHADSCGRHPVSSGFCGGFGSNYKQLFCHNGQQHDGSRCDSLGTGSAFFRNYHSDGYVVFDGTDSVRCEGSL